jgi:hypothetical protein
MSCEAYPEYRGQPFPKSNKDLISVNEPLPGFRDSPPEPIASAQVFAYVLTTVRLQGVDLIQDGSAPNFQGDRITLCTCMRMHRTWWPTWQNICVAGFSQAAFGNRLFYFMQVGAECASHFDLWHSGLLPDPSKKSAATNRLGDVFAPKASCNRETRYDPEFYEPPTSHPSAHPHVHLANDVWKQDICFRFPATPARQPKLLVGAPGRSFLWSNTAHPAYSYRYAPASPHPRFKVYKTVSDFYKCLK